MSEQYEPSYYEIALTGRQVLVAFVILLISLVAAFFSGVWVGREELVGGPGTETVAEAPAETSDETGVPGAETTAGSDLPPAEDQGVEELSFFEEGRREAPEPDESERPREPVGEEVTERPADGGTSEPATSGQPVNPRQTVNPSGALAGGDLVVQVLSSSDQAAARNLMDRLREVGFRVFISPVVDGGETYYRVRVGPFEHRAEAEEVEAELQRRFDLDTWITR